MSNCKKIIDVLCDYLEGHMGPDDRKALENHLEDCPSCDAFFESYQKISFMCRNLRPDRIPPELSRRLMDFLREKAEAEGRKDHLR